MGGSYEAPDMASANREAVLAQAETFPLLRTIEAASRLGRAGEYIDPRTGQATPYDFRGMSDIDITRETARALAEMAPELTKQQLDVAKEFGTQFAEQRRKELETADPERFKLYEEFLRDIRTGGRGVEERAPEAPEYERVSLPPELRDTGMSATMRAELERQIGGELAQAGGLPPGLQRATEQALRARGAATGNILGNASALREALGVSQAIQQSDAQRRAQALGLLQSGQTTSDVAQRNAQQAFQNILAATGQRNVAAQQTFSGQMAAQQQRQAGRQQNIANIQSALGLTPIVSQAAQLGGLQQGASPFAQPQMMQGMQQAGPGQLLAQGSQFALQNAAMEFQESQANSPMAIARGVSGVIGSLGSVAGMCAVARLCIPDEWEGFFFWKELLAPNWFRELYNSNAEKIASWMKDKPRVQKVVAKWMRSKISEVANG